VERRAGLLADIKSFVRLLMVQGAPDDRVSLSTEEAIIDQDSDYGYNSL
jgi:hypothetical protein